MKIQNLSAYLILAVVCGGFVQAAVGEGSQNLSDNQAASVGSCSDGLFVPKLDDAWGGTRGSQWGGGRSVAFRRNPSKRVGESESPVTKPTATSEFYPLMWIATMVAFGALGAVLVLVPIAAALVARWRHVRQAAGGAGHRSRSQNFATAGLAVRLVRDQLGKENSHNDTAEQGSRETRCAACFR